MKIGKIIRESFFGNLFNKIFLEPKEVKLSETKTGLLLQKIPPSNGLASIFVILATTLVMYENIFDKSLPLLGNDFLPPVFLFAAHLFLDKRDFRIRKYHLWYLGFLFISLLAGFIGVFEFSAGKEVLLGFFVLAQFGLAFIVGELLKKDWSNTFLVITAPLVIGGVWQYFTGGGFRYSYLESAGVRLTSFLENPNIFAFLLVLIALVIFKNIFSAPTIKKNYLWSVYLAVCLILIFLTGSRAGWLALGLGLVTQLVILRPNLLFFSPLVFILLAVERVRERVLLVFSPNYLLDSSIDGRLWAIKNSLFIWSKNIFGTGPGTYGDRFARDASSAVYLEGLQNGYPAILTTDNQYLATLVQTGILGLIGFLGFWISLAASFVQKKEALGASLIAAFAVMMLFSNAFNFGLVVIPVGILLGQRAAK